jgi:hypothetical protein
MVGRDRVGDLEVLVVLAKFAEPRHNAAGSFANHPTASAMSGS